MSRTDNISKTLIILNKNKTEGAILKVFPITEPRMPPQWFAVINPINIDQLNPIKDPLMDGQPFINFVWDRMSSQSCNTAICALDDMCAEFLNRREKANVFTN